MRVKIDTSSLIYAVKSGLIELMFKLFDEVVVSEGVAAEATRKRGHPDSEAIARMIREGKLKVATAKAVVSESLGRGEREVIGLALEEPKGEYLLIMDDRRARSVAWSLGIAAVPVYAVLLIAVKRGVIDETRALALLDSLCEVARYPRDRVAEVAELIRLVARGEI